jgi:hypothetical protein
VSYKRIDLTGSLDLKKQSLNPKLNVSVMIFPSDVKFQNGPSNTFIPIKAGTAKFTIQIENWPFLSKNNSLKFGVSFVSGGGRSTPMMKSSDKDRDDDDDDNERKQGRQWGTNLTTILVGPGRLDSPSLGFVDGKNVTVKQEKNDDTTDGNFGIQWVFPYFEKKLFFDPTLDVSSPDAPPTAMLDFPDSNSNSNPSTSPTQPVSTSDANHRFFSKLFFTVIIALTAKAIISMQ